MDSSLGARELSLYQRVMVVVAVVVVVVGGGGCGDGGRFTYLTTTGGGQRSVNYVILAAPATVYCFCCSPDIYNGPIYDLSWGRDRRYVSSLGIPRCASAAVQRRTLYDTGVPCLGFPYVYGWATTGDGNSNRLAAGGGFPCKSTPPTLSTGNWEFPEGTT